ncbi:glutathione-disulfide reductase [Caenispirillum bisanense]|uniref:Glutathione reductase n=1 Tax=Caenispirillum bisanense TaxID=414052 RepID=A0A286GMW4_9PROT|nr:glutathione-disulfide reductase [Caenispirillum bisanense]SOD96877.1 NADPH-glutathione reductase [Caenispirillum bisanense]
MAQYDYDLITIGAGSGGVRATRLAGGWGHKVAIVESSRVGGTCVMRGCVPKKLLVYGAHFAEDFEDAKGYGWTLGDVSFDWPTLVGNKNKELDRLQGVYERILRDNKVELLRGRGVIVDPHTVEVDGQRHTAEKILIAVGGWPTLPDIPGIEHAVTSNEALDLPDLPKRVTIVGGGYIAVEFAGIFHALGSQVTQVIRKEMILRGFDGTIRAALQDELIRQGIDLRCETTVRSIEKTPSGAFNLRFAGGDEHETDLVMYATGRAPNTKGLGLEEVGVEMRENGAIVVDENARTSVDSIFAIGDVTDRVNLTPVAINEGRCFAETFFHDNPMTMDYTNIASAVFSQPPVGSVGMSEEEARRRGKVKIFISRFRPMKYTLSGREERTVMKLIVDAETDVVLGAHMVGVDAPEIVQGIAIALKCGATKKQFDATVGIHPTAAEEFVTMRDPIPDPSPEHTE